MFYKFMPVPCYFYKLRCVADVLKNHPKIPRLLPMLTWDVLSPERRMSALQISIMHFMLGLDLLLLNLQPERWCRSFGI